MKTLFLFFILALSASANVTYSVTITQPHTAFTDSDVYIDLKPVVTVPEGLTAPNLYFRLLDETRPYLFEQCYRGDTQTGYSWRGGSAVVLKVRTPKHVGPITYKLQVEAGGAFQEYSITVNVRSLYSDLPGVATWEQTMLQLGRKWCHPTFVYSFGVESQVWYYDGARVFFQIADYTGDSSFSDCAFNIARQYRDYVVQNKGRVMGNRVFTKGLSMAFERSGDVSFKDAVLLIAQNGIFAKGGYVSEHGIRESAYILDAFADSEYLGAPRHVNFGRQVDILLGYFDRLFVSNDFSLHQLFFDGLGAEALIEAWELTHDPRIPVAIRIMLDWVWAHAWKPGVGLIVNPDPVGPRCSWGCQEATTDLINLVVPAFAWYWQYSGDTTYRDRGDEIFKLSLKSDISYSGKIFSQNFKWTFKYLAWRAAR